MPTTYIIILIYILVSLIIGIITANFVIKMCKDEYQDVHFKTLATIYTIIAPVVVVAVVGGFFYGLITGIYRGFKK